MRTDHPNRMRNQNGYSLIELLTVVVILGIIAAIAIPNLLRARQLANSSSAILSLRTISTAQHLFRRLNNVYGTMEQLTESRDIDTALGSGQKSGYVFQIVLLDDGTRFTCIATPMDKPDVYDHYYVDETAVIRFNSGAPADSTSTPIPR